MAIERTLSIVKPDAMAKGVAFEILRRFEQAGLRVIAIKALRLTEEDARGFYAVHRERPFFNDLTAFMTSGPVVVLALERENAISTWRGVMGATNPAEADEGTLRKQFGTNVERNATHGSDAPETAATEVAYFFNALEIHRTS